MKTTFNFQKDIKKLGFFMVVMISLLLTFSCKKESSTGFTNKLQFGESVNLSGSGFPVVNEKYTFAFGSTVSFRLETKDDFGSSDFKLVVKSGSTVVATIPYSSLQSYGHIYASSFFPEVDGVFTIEAYVVNGNKLIDTKTLTITP